jgi:starvation-inducible DNA-binding protein
MSAFLAGTRFAGIWWKGRSFTCHHPTKRQCVLESFQEMGARTSVATRQFSTHIDIPMESREQLIALLNEHLADTFDLMSQTKQAHWNVKGTDFYQFHLLFDEIAGELAEFVDSLAERATSLGGYASGTVRMAAENSSLPEYPAEISEGIEHVKALVERFALYAARIRTAIDAAIDLGDQSTGDLYIEISRAVDKRLWFLEAHIQRAN